MLSTITAYLHCGSKDFEVSMPTEVALALQVGDVLDFVTRTGPVIAKISTRKIRLTRGGDLASMHFDGFLL